MDSFSKGNQRCMLIFIWFLVDSFQCLVISQVMEVGHLRLQLRRDGVMLTTSGTNPSNLSKVSTLLFNGIKVQKGNLPVCVMLNRKSLLF